MARLFDVNIDMQKNSIIHLNIEVRSSAPASPTTGYIYYDSTLNEIGIYNGSSWIYSGGAPSTQNVFTGYQAAVTAPLEGSLSKVALGTVVSDPMGYWSAANTRWTPAQAGYYLVTVMYDDLTTALPVGDYIDIVAYKNGAAIGTQAAVRIESSDASAGVQGLWVGLVQMNGTTDYIEPYIGSNVSGHGGGEITMTAAAVGTSGPTGATGPMQLAYTAQAASYVAASGQYVLMTNGGTARTVTLPAPTNGRIVGVESVDGTGAVPTTVSTPSGAITGPGVAAAATSILLGAPHAFVIVQADGTNWRIIAGEQDSGWIALSSCLTNGWTAGSQTPAYRLTGNRVVFRGDLVPGSTGNCVQMPAGYLNANSLSIGPVILSGGSLAYYEALSSGIIYVSSLTTFWLDPIFYFVD